MSRHQATMSRSFNLLQFYISTALNAEGFTSTQYISDCIRDDVLTGLWAYPRLMTNVTGALLERPLSFSSAREVASVGRCVLQDHSMEVSVHALKVCGAVVEGRTLQYQPPFEKLLVVLPPDLVPHVRRYPPPAPYPAIPDHITEQIQRFAVDYLEGFVATERTHPDYHVHFNICSPSATRVMSPQEAIINYAWFEGIPLRAMPPHVIVNELGQETMHKVAGAEGDEREIDLYNETLDLELPLRGIWPSASNVVHAYLSTVYRSSTSLMFEILPTGRPSTPEPTAARVEEVIESDDAESMVYTDNDDAAAEGDDEAEV